MTNQIQYPEILDLVNDNDEIIGEIEKDKANKSPNLIHREVGVLIFDNQNRMLVQQRSFKKTHGPGQWQVAASGHVPKGMTYEDAIHKELKEELGFDTKLIPLEKIFNQIATETRFVWEFIGKYEGQEIVIQKEEVEQAKFIDQNEFKEMKGNFGPGSQKLIQNFFDGHYKEFISKLN